VEREESDEELMARLAGGDLEALGDVYERHGPRLLAALAGLASDFGAAEREELLQDVFLAVAGSAATFRGASRVYTWLCGIAIRKVRFHRRGEGTRQRIRERHGAACAGVSRQGAGSPERIAECREAAFAALSRLSEDQREVIWLHAVEEMSATEIGSAIGVSPSTVWTRLHRARKRLSRAVREQKQRKTTN
jgi:RNA polymerase sigma-70 factor (ECF subfamily)